ncbi:MAG TPA: hypothetical protein VFR18_26115, partial [Terriglobia bacterium]|nr:hypothetical protein [Terriglobia bacterium]
LYGRVSKSWVLDLLGRFVFLFPGVTQGHKPVRLFPTVGLIDKLALLVRICFRRSFNSRLVPSCPTSREVLRATITNPQFPSSYACTASAQ